MLKINYFDWGNYYFSVWNFSKQLASLDKHKYTLHFLHLVLVRLLHPLRLQHRAELRLSTVGQCAKLSNLLSIHGDLSGLYLFAIISSSELSSSSYGFPFEDETRASPTAILNSRRSRVSFVRTSLFLQSSLYCSQELTHTRSIKWMMTFNVHFFVLKKVR